MHWSNGRRQAYNGFWKFALQRAEDTSIQTLHDLHMMLLIDLHEGDGQRKRKAHAGWRRKPQITQQITTQVLTTQITTQTARSPLFLTSGERCFVLIVVYGGVLLIQKGINHVD